MNRAALLLCCLTACAGPQLPPLQNVTPVEVANERTWWWICWSEDDVQQPLYPAEEYPHTPACQTPELVTWPQNRVYFTVDASASAYRGQVLAAAKQWNTWAGREVFVEVADGAVRIKGDQAIALYASGITQHYRHRGALFCDVTLAPGMTGYAYAVVLHELGHVLGFGHDGDSPTSLMHPTAPSTQITRRDLGALRQRYGRS